MHRASSPFTSDRHNLVVHHLKLEFQDKADVEEALSDIASRFPFDDVCFDEPEHVLNLAYDASRLDTRGLFALLKKHHLVVSRDWWTHSRQGYEVVIARRRHIKHPQ